MSAGLPPKCRALMGSRGASLMRSTPAPAGAGVLSPYWAWRADGRERQARATAFTGTCNARVRSTNAPRHESAQQVAGRTVGSALSCGNYANVLGGRRLPGGRGRHRLLIRQAMQRKRSPPRTGAIGDRYRSGERFVMQ